MPLWAPVAIVAGIAGWFLLPGPRAWEALTSGAAGVALLALAFGRGGRGGRALAIAAGLVALGCALVWWQAERVGAPRLDRPQVARLTGTVERIEPLPARAAIRLIVRTSAPDLPPRLRITVPAEHMVAGVRAGARIAVRARLVPPPSAAAPGAYDYARVAWFAGIGATGRALDPVRVDAPAPTGGPGRWLADARVALSAHIQARLAGGEGGVATALATGDMGGIDEADNDAFRRSGLAHLLSVSGLHLTAAVGAAMLVVLKLLALSPHLAERAPLPLIAAVVAALVGVAYTLLTGAEVPTVRSLVAALIVLLGLAIGREALTLRLVAAGALVVLLAWPAQAAGASFQLSFAAILAIVALHELPWARAAFARRDEPVAHGLARATASVLLTGLVVEAALMPIAVFHFHRAGFYGAVANIVAIPLTTFVVMPAEATALLLDAFGLGAPLWWIAGKSIAVLLWLARTVSALPGSTLLVPTMGRGAFALIVAGGLWLALWRTRVRIAGLAPIVAGVALTLAGRPPDLLVTGDGRHVAIRTAGGDVALLRDRTGDYLRDALSELGGREGDTVLAIDGLPEARCTRDICTATLSRGGRAWRLLATRSRDLVAAPAFRRACARADIVVADRRLPDWCRPRWLKADRALLATTGGLAIRLDPPAIETVAEGRIGKPWR